MVSDLHQVCGILFDLWNTLVFSRFDRNPMVLIAEALRISDRPGWRKVIERGMMTRPFLGIREALSALEREAGGAPLGSAERERLIRLWNEACAATEVYDDVAPALDALRGRFRLGILSNTQSFDLDFLRTKGLASRVDALCLSCEEGRLKPDPLLFATAVSRLGLPPEEVLMVGDNEEDDVEGAGRAGLKAVLLARQAPRAPAPAAAAVVGRLTALSALLAPAPPARE